MELTRQETELVELIRGQDAKNFSVTVTADGGRWIAILSDLDSSINGNGRGSNFNEAWDDIVDPRLRGE